MQFFKYFISATLLFTTSTLAAPCPDKDITAQWRAQIVRNWQATWAGDFSKLNQTVSEDVQVYQDRFPTGHGSASHPISNSTALLAFMKYSRAPFTQYAFNDDLVFGADNMIAVRWTLNATYAGAKGTTLKAGSPVAYNGTDILILNKCTGLADQVLTAQDLITYFHDLGAPIGVV